jgi:hypothetical protein
MEGHTATIVGVVQEYMPDSHFSVLGFAPPPYRFED